MTLSAAELNRELRSIRDALRSLHFARLDQDAEVAAVHARLERLTRDIYVLTTSAVAPSPTFTNGDGI